MQNLKKAVLKAIEAYNHFRSPEATAKLVKIDEDRLIMDFEGSFCTGCGVYDYLEDFIYELQNFVDVDMEILHFENCGSETIRVVYKVKLAVGQE
jgi:hypothetical protein